MYKYDKENDRIIDVDFHGNYEPIKTHLQLETLREALGLKKHSEQKYTVQIVINNSQGFLNIDKTDNNSYFLSDVSDAPDYQAQFTQAEIDKLKRCDDLAIDWDKAIIKPVEDVDE